MSVGQMHESEHSGPSGSDVFISMLGAVVAAGVAWSVVFGLFAGASYGLEYFKIVVPEIVTTVLRVGSMIVPVLVAIPAAFLGYKFILRLP
jgi:hypothetical protein